MLFSNVCHSLRGWSLTYSIVNCCTEQGPFIDLLATPVTIFKECHAALE